MLTAIYILLALVVTGTAAGMVLSRNAVYAALFLALNFISVGVLYLIMGAPFIALVQVTVYAGSIMVLFLFVIMLLGAENLPTPEPIHGQRLFAIVLVLAMFAAVGALIVVRSGLGTTALVLPETFGSPGAIGKVLFTQYSLHFMVTSIILLAATVGAILLTRADRVHEKQKALLGRKEG